MPRGIDQARSTLSRPPGARARSVSWREAPARSSGTRSRRWPQGRHPPCATLAQRRRDPRSTSCDIPPAAARPLSTRRSRGRQAVRHHRQARRDRARCPRRPPGSSRARAGRTPSMPGCPAPNASIASARSIVSETRRGPNVSNTGIHSAGSIHKADSDRRPSSTAVARRSDASSARPRAKSTNARVRNALIRSRSSPRRSKVSFSSARSASIELNHSVGSVLTRLPALEPGASGGERVGERLRGSSSRRLLTTSTHPS